MFHFPLQKRWLTLILYGLTLCLCTTQIVAMDSTRQEFVIHLKTRNDIKLLKKYPLEIVRVRTKNKTKRETQLHQKVIVEAISSPETIKRLKRDGFILKSTKLKN